jgi:phosphopantothenoylcysteine decarboxylase/phosphopantothenate--cysteine ligase
MALIALGVSGGIGAYKAVEIARGLQKQGHDVAAIMTRAARRFVGPLTFEAITRREVLVDQWKPGANADIEHISVASSAALLLVAPATANIIGKFANGIADDFLTSLYLATTAPVLLAPAMNVNMFAHPAVKRNLDTLAARGVMFVEPGEGYLACGWIGKGRLAEPAEVVDAVQRVLTPAGPLNRTRVLVTAGPTYEDIDPVRYIGNRSSGRMGYAVAAEAARRGAEVTLISGPTKLDAPRLHEIVQVRSAGEMHEAVLARAAGVDVVIMAAAVADYTVPAPDDQKITKSDGPLVLTLARTRDILGDLGKLPSRQAGRRPLLIGFAAETHDVLAHARGKLERKAVDLIVANDVTKPGAGFDTTTNAVTLVSMDGAEQVPLQSKTAVAGRILDRVERLLAARPVGSVG